MSEPIYHFCPHLLLKYLECIIGVSRAYDCTFNSGSYNGLGEWCDTKDKNSGCITFRGKPVANWFSLYNNTNIPVFYFIGEYKSFEVEQTNFWRKATLHLAGLEYNHEGMIVQENAIMDCQKFRDMVDRANKADKKRFDDAIARGEFDNVRFPRNVPCYL